ncbi:hypothetical protein KUTeg_003930 [Tegillarca granosa]|uniref:Neurotransmitter-gated ion-channel ligand-binding domain-containing protein n=1 Tax=Tegillarca granosa TaxID=220873 RepID=A0ABQ9FNH1_TEGGR|nr:hypothetical protein KUTeg_003930 [Tegillarca granosa]
MYTTDIVAFKSTISAFDIKAQTLSITGWLTMTLNAVIGTRTQNRTRVLTLSIEWEDERLTWDKTNATTESEVAFALPTEIWWPEVFVDNSYGSIQRQIRFSSLKQLQKQHIEEMSHPPPDEALNTLGHYNKYALVNCSVLFLCFRMASVDIVNNANLLFRINSTGQIDWEVPRIFVTSCTVDISCFPFDTQRCSVQIGARRIHLQRVNRQYCRINRNKIKRSCRKIRTVILYNDLRKETKLLCHKHHLTSFSNPIFDGFGICAACGFWRKDWLLFDRITCPCCSVDFDFGQYAIDCSFYLISM